MHLNLSTFLFLFKKQFFRINSEMRHNPQLHTSSASSPTPVEKQRCMEQFANCIRLVKVSISVEKIPKVSPERLIPSRSAKGAALPPSIHSSWCCSSWGTGPLARGNKPSNAAALWLKGRQHWIFHCRLRNELVLRGALMWTPRFQPARLTGSSHTEREVEQEKRSPLGWRSGDD